MKRILLLIALFIPVASLSAQNAPVIGTPQDATLFTGSGLNFLMIPNVSDGDEGVGQEISFSATSSDPSILEINDVSYSAGHTMAVIHATEKGLSGTVSISVEATDEDGSVQTSFDVSIGAYHNQGINFEIHDIVFWQTCVPLNSSPAFSMIAENGMAPYSQIDLKGLDLSVYADCDGDICTGTDFFTALFKGYLIPPVSGDYYFYMVSGDHKSIGISDSENFDDAEVILHSVDGIGTNAGEKEWKSVQVSLEAGKCYAIYGTHWNVHTLMGGLKWEGPGIEKEYIPGEYLSYVYDVSKPSVPANFKLLNTGITDIMLSWSAATDDRNIAGYNLYLNGLRFNDTPLKDTSCQLGDLNPGTDYCMVVTSVDMAGNESAESNPVCTTTYLEDEVAPLPPTSLEAKIVSDLGLKVAWSGASDGETEIRGYRLYVNGELYTVDGLIYEEESGILGLTPETDYAIEVEALDAAYNVSDKSEALIVSTTAFSPYDASISSTKGRLSILLDPIGRSEGIGINPNYVSGEFLDDPEQVRLIKELEAGAIRWGALEANPLNFKDFTGPGKPITFGRFMDFCNQTGAYTVISCGVEDGSDWRKHPETFSNFLEYLAGGAETTYGAKRVAEGYSQSLLEGSPGMVFEFGNEVWGADAHAAQIGSDYAEYGRWCREMATIMRASNYFDDEKIFLSYSGRRPVASDSYGLYEELFKGDTGEVDWLAVSGYLGGNLNYSPEIDPGESELEYYKNGIREMIRNLNGLEETMDVVLQTCGDIKPTYFYESNMTTSAYYGRLGQAVIQTDYYASLVEKGGVLPTIFHLTDGQWKMVVPSQDYKKLPLFHTTMYYNRYCKGNALKTDFATSLNTSYDPVGCHIYSEGDAFGLMLASRDFENDWTVQLDLPDELELMRPESVKMYTITGNGYSTKKARIDSSVVSMSDSMLIKVPKYSMVVMGFEGSGAGIENVPLGFYDYKAADSISIYALGGIEVYEINGRDKLIFKADVFPEGILSDAVIWSLEPDSVEASYALMPYGFDVRGSGTCNGNGTVRVRAHAWDNPAVYDEVEVTISGQGSNCNVGIEGSMKEELRIYPNPASGLLYVSGLPDGTKKLEVFDIGGRLCLSAESVDKEAEIDLSDFDSGLYLLKVSGSRELLIRKFICD